MRVFALLPAAGKSVRMGRPKLALPLGESTVLEHVLHTLDEAGLDERLVVIGPHVVELTFLCQRAGASFCLLDEETPDMRATLERGLDWIETHFHPTDEDAWLLVPSDCGAIRAEVVRRLVAEYERCTQTIVVPSYEGRRGHPALIGWQHVAGVRSHPADEGLNTYLSAHAHERLEVPVTFEDVLWDLDTPEDYERLLAWWEDKPP